METAIVGTLVISAAGALGFFMRQWLNEIARDVISVGGALDDIVDKIASHSDRLARLEGWQAAMTGLAGGRRATDPPSPLQQPAE